MKHRLTVTVVAAALTVSCGDVNLAIERLSQARHLSADLLVQFTKASNATDRAVMADTDASSVTYARDARAANGAIHSDVKALRPLLGELRYSDETAILDQFDRQLGDYEQLDHQILDLAVENTNLKAQALSFGEAQSAADVVAQSVDALRPASPAEGWHVKAAAATAVGAVRQIQVLQAPHIAAPEDASMSTIEARMKTEEATARSALAALSPLVDPASRGKLAAATDALNQFMDLNTRIVGFSRQNSNVRSLALALNQKPARAAPCEQSLRALDDALAHHGLPKGRWE
jgi:hypothetical protein